MESTAAVTANRLETSRSGGKIRPRCPSACVFPPMIMKFKSSAVLVSGALLMFAACGKPSQEVRVENPSTETGDILETEKVQVFMNNGRAITDPQHGRENGFWYGAVSGVNGTSANGVAYTYSFEDGAFLHTLNVNIKKLDKGEYYVAWLTEAGGKNPVKLGWLANLFGDVRHSVSLDTKTNITNHTHVVVTKETTKDPSQPGAVVAEGDVKRYDRPQ